MAERLVTRRLFTTALVSGVATTGLVSSAIDLRIGVMRIDGLLVNTTSPTSTPDVGITYAGSPDGTTRASFADQPAMLTSTVTLGSGFHVVSVISNTRAPFVFFALSGTGSNPTDALVTVDVLLRMSQ